MQFTFPPYCGLSSPVSHRFSLVFSCCDTLEEVEDGKTSDETISAAKSSNQREDPEMGNSAG